MSELTDAINQYIARGWSVIPIRRGEKKPCEEWEEWGIMAPDRPQWKVWWAKYDGCSVAVVYSGCVTEPGLQLVCVDTDNPEQEAWVQAQQDNPATPTVETCDGRHRYYLAPAGLEHFPGTAERPEIRAGVHYSLLPPSLHPDGVVYSWAEGLSLDDAPLAELPPWGCDIMRGGPEAQQPRARRQSAPQGPDTSSGDALQEGGRNDGLFRVCARWRAANVPEYQLSQATHAYNSAHCHPPLSPREVDSIVKSVLRYAPGTSEREQVSRRRQQAPQQPPAEPPPLPDEDPLAQHQSVAEACVNEIEVPHTTVTATGARLSDIADTIIDEFETYRKLPRVVTGLRSGFPSLDNHFLGFSRFPLIVVQGPSGFGKSTFANHCLFATALAEARHERPALTVVFMLESTREQLASIYLGYRWELPTRVREPGSEAHLVGDLEDRMVAGYSEFPVLPIAVHDDVKDIGRIEWHIRSYAEEGPVAGVIIDHAQEVVVPGPSNRHDQVSQVAVRFRDLADKLRIPIMLLSQTKLKDGEYVPEYSQGLRQKASLCFIVTRGGPGMSREDAVQSNITRVSCDKSRGWRPSPPLKLMGNWETGRLWEVEEETETRAQQQGEGNLWHDN